MDQERIGGFIAALRKEKQMTQAQLAERLGVSNKTISRWENGKNMPDYSILEDLTAELGITINELIRGERILEGQMIKEYEHNLVDILKEYKRMKIAKNIILYLLLALIGISLWLAVVLGLPAASMASAKIEVSEDVSEYNDYIGQDALKKYRSKWGVDETIFPEKITEEMQVEDFKMVYYDPWDAQYLSYLVVRYDETAYQREYVRLKDYDSTEYIGCYGISGFSWYELLAIYLDEDFGFVYALNDEEAGRIIYVEMIFCNHFMDIDYKEYIDSAYLPDGLDLSR